MNVNLFSMWQFNVALYLISIVVFFQFNRLAVKEAKDNAAATLILQTVASTTILFLIPFFPITFSSKWSIYGLVVLASIFYALNDRLQTPIRKHLEVSLFTIINQLVYVFLFLYGIIIFNESVNAYKILGILLILSANALVLYKKGTFSLSKYVVMALVAALALGTAISIDVGTSKEFNLPIYIIITLLIPALLIALSERVGFKRMKTEYITASKKYYLIAGIAWASTIFFSLRALQLGEVTRVVPMQAFSVILNVLVAYAFLHERSNTFKKLAAATLAVVGIVLTTMS